MISLLVLGEPRFLTNKLNGTQHIEWSLLDEHGRGYLISWLEKAVDTGQPECMAFKARRRQDGDVHVDSWNEKAVSHNPDAATALLEVLLQLTRNHDIRIVVDDDMLALFPQGKAAPDAQ